MGWGVGGIFFFRLMTFVPEKTAFMPVIIAFWGVVVFFLFPPFLLGFGPSASLRGAGGGGLGVGVGVGVVE